MRRFLTFLVSVIFALSINLLPANAQDSIATAPAEIVFNQLKSDDAVTEIWVPILPVGYQIDDVTIYEDGSYTFAISATVEDEKIVIFNLSIAAKKTAAVSDAKLNPFQAWLKQTENQGDSWQDCLTKAELVEDVVYYKSNTADMLSGPVYRNFQNKDAAVMMWRAGGSSSVLPSDIFEVAVSLSENMVGSVSFRANVVGSFDLWQLFNDEFPMVFVTCGDADLNGMVNATDALILLKHTVGKTEITDATARLMADYNDDGEMNADDALSVLRKVVGK